MDAELIQEQVDAYLKELGVTYTPTFVPTPQSHEKNPQLHWLVKLERRNRTMEVTYRQGIGHVKNYKTLSLPYDRQRWGKCFRLTCETGKLYKPMDSLPFEAKIGEQPAPVAAGILYCVVSDADVLNYASYEEWARDMGFDEDRRKGEQTYQACLKQSLALKQIFNETELNKLRELVHDY